MQRRIGTISRGLRGPIVKEGDDLRKIVVDTFMDCVNNGEFEIGRKDVLAITESILARSEKNYATTEQLATDVRNKLGGETVGVVFPILSRNRFAICLRGIAKGCKKVVLMLSYPSDEVGNHLLDIDKLDEKGVDPYKDVLTQEEFDTRKEQLLFPKKAEERKRKAEIKVSSPDTYKVYRALVKCEDEIKEEDLEKLQSLHLIKQRTPIRVSHRRADKIREKEVKSIEAELIDPKTFEMIIKTEGGLYIKELISSDEGRSNPSVSEVLGTQAICAELDVIEVGIK